MNSIKQRRYTHEKDEFEETRNSTLLTKNYNLLEWIDNLEMGTPSFFIPQQIADFVGSIPFCRFAISPRLDRVAIMNFNRELNVYTLEGDIMTHESSVQVLEDEFPEYCLLQYSECGNLILSTRSTAHIDVFDHSGGYCYDIPLEENSSLMDLRNSISCFKTYKNSSITSDDKYLNWLYVLQYSGTFTVFKIGRLSRYCPMWRTQLNVGLASIFVIIREYNLLLVGAHYPVKSDVKQVGGLCSFRIIDEDPYLDPIRMLQDTSGWFKHFPFTSYNYAFISSMSVNLTTPKKMVAVSTNGDIFVYDLPSTLASTFVKYISGPRPTQAVFIDSNEIAILFNDGSLLRSEVENLRDAVLEADAENNFNGRAEMSSPGARELFILVEKNGSGAHRELVSERTFLAARIWFSTFWSMLKSLVGVAVGDTPTPLQIVKHSDSFSFVLWYLPTRTLQQLLDRTLNDRDYEGAKRLADQYESINVDIILKREWEDVCESNSVTTAAVTDILKRIGDELWIAEACASCLSTNFEAQKTLASLGLSLSKSLPVETRVRLLHNARILAITSSVSFYLENRGKSLLCVAQELAKIGDISGLQRLLETKYSLIKPYLLSILNYLPPALPPSKFLIFLPRKNGDLKDIQETVIDDIEKVESLLYKENPSLMFSWNFGGSENMTQDDDYLEWVRKRAITIEADTGLYTHSKELLEISISNGFEKLEQDFLQWKHYLAFTKLCSSINETFSGFLNLSLDNIITHISKTSDADIIKHASDILSLVEYFACEKEDISKILRPLLISSCERSTKVVKKFKKIRPSLFDKELITECLKQSSLTGKYLLDELQEFAVYPELCSAIRALLDLGVKPTFQKLLESTHDEKVARTFLMRALATVNASTPEEWETLRSDVIQIAENIYDKLISREEILQLLAKELLHNDMLRTNSELLETILTLHRTGPKESNGIKLGQIKSAEVLMNLSVDCMNEVVRKNDPSLDKSRFFSTLAKQIAPKSANDHLKILDAIDIMYELGSMVMPAAIRLCDPVQLLQQIIEIGSNYKKGKSLAKLASLLDIPTPVSTALSFAALSAIEHRDEECLKKYIAEIMKARDISIVHKLCLQIIKSSYIVSSLEDIYACALLNCPNEELTNTLSLIEESKKNQRIIISCIPEPISEIITEASFSSVATYVKTEPLSDNCQFALTNLTSQAKPSEAACIWSRKDAATAISLSLMKTEENEIEWTASEKLARYEKALHFFLPKLTPFLVQSAPPNFLISQYNKVNGSETPLDRIEQQGVNRERFVTDSSYREDSLNGLAMTDDDRVFEDAIFLANQFHIDDWRLHMASLENALTTCSPAEAKRILKERRHLSKLRTNLFEFHTSLRKDVLPLVETNEMFIAYLSLFSEDQPEKAAFTILKKLIEKKKDLKAKKLFTNSTYLKEVIISMPDKYIVASAESLRKYETGVVACEAAAKILLNGTDVRPPASIVALYALLNNDEGDLIDLIASKKLEDEIRFLQEAVIILEATPSSPENLISLVKDRLSLLTKPVETFSYHEPREEHSVLTSRRKH